MAKFVRSHGTLINIYKQSDIPTKNQGVSVGDIWIDLDSVPISVNICSSINPVTFIQVEVQSSV